MISVQFEPGVGSCTLMRNDGTSLHFAADSQNGMGTNQPIVFDFDAVHTEGVGCVIIAQGFLPIAVGKDEQIDATPYKVEKQTPAPDRRSGDE